MIGTGAPPCCTGCDEYDRADGICRLLAEPTLDNRRRLLTMPCRVERLLAHRFRGYDEDVARDAIVAWLDPGADPDDIAATYGRAPRDARLWLTSWPYLYLARNSVRRLHRDADREGTSPAREPEAAPGPEPALATRVTRALEKVHRIDPIGYAMLLEFLRDRFDAKAWASALGVADATVTDRKYLGIYRYASYFHEIVESVAPHEAAVALVARRFSPGEPTEHAALAATRETLGNPALTLAEWRKLYRDGAMKSLALLAAPDALGRDTMTELGTAFRRVLRLET